MHRTLTLRKQAVRWLLIVLLLAISALTVSAQDSIPINVGENQTGEISAAQPTARYSLTITSPQAVNVQVLGLTPGFIPTFRVLDPSGIVIQSVANDGTQTTVNASLTLLNVGTYRIEVESTTGTAGQFVISVQAGAPIQPPQPLTIGQRVEGEVNSEAPNQSYSFTGSDTAVLRLTVRSSSLTSSPMVMLIDSDLNETLGISSARLAGVQYRIPSGVVNYLVSVTHNGTTGAAAYVLCLEDETAPQACAGEVPVVIAPTLAASNTPIPLPTLPSTGACVVAPVGLGAVNVRSGPGTNFSVATQLPGNTTAAVVGKLPDNSWYQVNVNGIVGWISGTVVRLGGQCGSVPAVTLTPSGAVTPTATRTGTPATATATSTGTATPTATVTLTPSAAPTLNFSLPAVYGSTALTSGFIPDPFTVGITAGGPASASYLGGGCTGYTTSAPSFSVNYTSGAFPLLRFYFIGSGDTTMIINTPSGSYVCVDDSFGTLNPTLDFNTPSSGRYDVWIGTFDAGGSIGGTLYVTESSSNRP